MHFLFVCLWNVQRSKTAEDVFRRLIGERDHITFELAGIAARPDLGGRQITKEMAEKADKIFVMEYEHEHYIVSRWPDAKKRIINLEIADAYYRGEARLIVQLERKLAPYAKK